MDEKPETITTRDSPSADGEIVVSFPVTAPLLRDACKASRIKTAGKFGGLGLRILGTISIALSLFSFYMFEASDSRESILVPAFVLLVGLYAIAIPSIQWRLAYGKTKRLFDRVGMKAFEYRFQNDKILSLTSQSQSNFTYEHLTLIIPEKKYLLMFIHNSFLFVPRNQLSNTDLDTILARFRKAGVKVRA